jgi:monofunctional biosynthetic peptidoglycan transglycosylase
MPDSRSPLLRAAAPRGFQSLLELWKARRKRFHVPTPPERRRWLLRIAVGLAALLLLDALYIAVRLPDWERVAVGPVPKSKFIQVYENSRADDASLPRLQWSPVPIANIPTHVIRAVVVAEDSRFYKHSGFDSEAFQDAMETNLTKGRFLYGGSTISQQTAKNLFFTPSRNPLRKWHELVFTYFMEKNLRKRRILEIYLNVAEFGRGIYGVEAAAQRYYNKSISEVTALEAIELAATLPAPVNHNPKSRTRFFIRHYRTVARHFHAAPGQRADSRRAIAPEPEIATPTPHVELENDRSSILSEPIPPTVELPAEATDEPRQPSAAPDRPEDGGDVVEPAR